MEKKKSYGVRMCVQKHNFKKKYNFNNTTGISSLGIIIIHYNELNAHIGNEILGYD